MKKIVFLALSYSDASSKPNLYTDLMGAFHKNGHDVLVVAPVLDKKNKVSFNTEEGIKVLRVPTFKLFGGGLIEKGISNVLLPYQYKKAIKKTGVALDFDLIITSTPPITLISVAVWLKRKTKSKLYLILRDIFPQNGVDLKLISKKGLPYRYFRKLEEKLYKESDKIGCMSPENINFVKRNNDHLDFSKLHLLKNWEALVEEIDENIIKKESLELRERYGLKNKIVALYGGNMGLPQQMENIINLAETVQDKKDLVFLILGWGTEKQKIVTLAKNKKLKNVIFLDSVTRIEFSNILRMADIGLITLNQNFTIPNYPSKVNAYYKFKIPVLAAVDQNTDFGKIQEEIGCGFWSVSGDTDAFKENLIKLYENEALRKEMGLKGYTYMINNLTPQHAYETIIKQF